jgi:hypothetical protein
LRNVVSQRKTIIYLNGFLVKKFGEDVLAERWVRFSKKKLLNISYLKLTYNVSVL